MKFHPSFLGGVILVLSILFTVGCQNPFNPDMRKQMETVQPSIADSPEKVLTNLQLAYNTQDIDLYKQCLSESFTFVLVASESTELGLDMDGDGIRDDWWGYDEEVLYHENLFVYGSSDGRTPPPYNISLSLQVPPDSLWNYTQTEDDGYYLIVPCYFDLRLSFETSEIIANGYARFFLTEEDEVWKIIRWQDESNI